MKKIFNLTKNQGKNSLNRERIFNFKLVEKTLRRERWGKIGETVLYIWYWFFANSMEIYEEIIFQSCIVSVILPLINLSQRNLNISAKLHLQKYLCCRIVGNDKKLERAQIFISSRVVKHNMLGSYSRKLNSH